MGNVRIEPIFHKFVVVESSSSRQGFATFEGTRDSTKPNLTNQTNSTKLTEPTLPNQTHQIYQTKPTKPNLSNQTYQTIPTPNLPNQSD